MNFFCAVTSRRFVAAALKLDSKLPWHSEPRRFMSTVKSNSNTRKRDHGFDNYMEVCKKLRKVLKFQTIIVGQPAKSISLAKLDAMGRRLGLKMYESGQFVIKHPHIFEVFEHPVQRILFCRLTPKALAQIKQEKNALALQEPESVYRIRKLLMMATSGRIRLTHIYHARRELGLPDDFEVSVILKYPDFFRLVSDSGGGKFVEIVERDPALATCAVEKAREKEYRGGGKSEEDIRFSFLINFPPGFRISRSLRVFVMKWQRMPYISPYDDISSHDNRTLEAQRCLHKRVVATLHEFLSLTVEKHISLEKIAHFRESFYLPNKLKDFLLQHQGIFYISTRGNQGKLHTIFLREAYKKGELIEPNPLYCARRKLLALILLSPRKAIYDESLGRYRMDERDDEKMLRDYVERSRGLDEVRVGEKGSDLDRNEVRGTSMSNVSSSHVSHNRQHYVSLGEGPYDDTRDPEASNDVYMEFPDMDMQSSDGSQNSSDMHMVGRNQ